MIVSFMNHYIKITEMNIIENYEKWLQKRIDNFGNENIINVILLEDKDEGSGTKYDDFTNIYNAIIASSDQATMLQLVLKMVKIV